MARRAAKRDSNERAIIDALEGAGCHVQQIDADDGAPDLVVTYYHCTGRWWLVYMEVKGPKGKLTPIQEQWWDAYGRVVGGSATAWIVRTVEEALDITGR